LLMENPEILDDALRHSMQQETELKQRWHRLRLLMSESYAPVWRGAAAVLVLLNVLLALSLVPTQVGGITTLAGQLANLEANRKSTEAELATESQKLITADAALTQVQSRTLPAGVEAQSVPDVQTISNHLNQIVEESAPRNFMTKKVRFVRMEVDVHTMSLSVEGRIKNDSMTMLDGKPIGSGYSLASSLIHNANRSPYFRDSMLEMIQVSADTEGALSFQARFGLQQESEPDPEDSNESFLEYLEGRTAEPSVIKRTP